MVANWEAGVKAWRLETELNGSSHSQSFIVTQFQVLSNVSLFEHISLWLKTTDIRSIVSDKVTLISGKIEFIVKLRHGKLVSFHDCSRLGMVNFKHGKL